MTTVLRIFAWTLAAGLITATAHEMGRDAGRAEDKSPRIWGYDCKRLDEPDANQVLCTKQYPTSYITCLSTDPNACR